MCPSSTRILFVTVVLWFQVYEQSVSVFLNGTFVSPAVYNVGLTAPAFTSKYRVGNTQAGV